MNAVEQEVYNFLIGKGLSQVAAYGIMGNIAEESSFSPTALNSKEGAIGLVQWEGGRRTALQSFAKAAGTSETDLNTQLNFMWHELNTTESSSLAAIKGAKTVADAAAIWDQSYERSAGTTRTARVNYAQQFASGANVPMGTQSASTAQIGGTSTSLNANDYEDALGTLGQVLAQVPELNTLLKKAVTSGESTEDFVNSIENSTWYKTHGTSYRQQFALKYSDPASYNQGIQSQQNQVTTQASQMGVKLTSTQAAKIAWDSLWDGWNSDQITQAIAGNYGASTAPGQHGQAASITDQMNQLAQAYGVPITTTLLSSWTQKILSGADTIDGFKASMEQSATSLYPGLAKQIAAGQSTTDIAQPYIAQMANILEVPSTGITLTDPTIKKALQASTTSADGKTTDPTLMPLYQFENQLRQDPRWQYTDNAKQSAASTLLQLGSTWGFNG